MAALLLPDMDVQASYLMKIAHALYGNNKEWHILEPTSEAIHSMLCDISNSFIWVPIKKSWFLIIMPNLCFPVSIGFLRNRDKKETFSLWL